MKFGDGVDAKLRTRSHAGAPASLISYGGQKAARAQEVPTMTMTAQRDPSLVVIQLTGGTTP